VTTTKPMPAWPTDTTPHDGHGGCAECEAYERALKEAYAARLKIAVEALLDIEDSREISAEQRRWVGDKLREIGPLPDEQHERTGEGA
jgi:hypothetical protein